MTMRVRPTTIIQFALCLSVCFLWSNTKASSTSLSWTPLNRYWKHIEENQAGLADEYDDDEIDQFQNIRSCLHYKLVKNDKLSLEEEQPYQSAILLKEQPAAEPTIVQTLKDRDNHTVLVEIGNAIPPQYAQAVKDLASCTQKFTPSQFEHRSFGKGGNDCTFLSVVLQIFLPQVAANVYRIAQFAYEMGNWDKQKYPSPQTCGLRTTEYLNYSTFSHLDVHYDAGSLFTALFSLSDQYEGGEFYIQANDDDDKDKKEKVTKIIEDDQDEQDKEEEEKKEDHVIDREKYTYFKPKQYSVLVFASTKMHGVTGIDSSDGGVVRETFTNEFWKWDDPPWPHQRPGLEDMEYFIKKVDLLGHSDYSLVDLEDMFPSRKELRGYLRQTGRKGIDEGVYDNADDDDDDDDDDDAYESEEYWDEEEEEEEEEYENGEYEYEDEEDEYYEEEEEEEALEL